MSYNVSELDILHADILHAFQEIAKRAQKMADRVSSTYVGDLFRTDYEVEGKDEFPIDMLRYTQSWPKDEESASAINFSIAHTEHNYGGSDVKRIKLTKYHRYELPTLAEDRWFSKFRWRVVKESIETTRT